MDAPVETLLLGPVSRDRYLQARQSPGSGAMNAWHWRQLGRPFVLDAARRSDAGAAWTPRPQRIPYLPDSIVEPGRSAAIDIVIEPDRQPHMDHFVDGVWAAFRLTPGEKKLLAGARRLHDVLVEPAIAELERFAAASRGSRSPPTSSASGTTPRAVRGPWAAPVRRLAGRADTGRWGPRVAFDSVTRRGDDGRPSAKA
jgi:hypothetical protein